MSSLTEYHLGRVDWASLRAMGDAATVPDAIRQLLAAESDADADRAYWRLDNTVVVQGQLFEAALALVPVLLAAATGSLSPLARVRLLDLVVEIASGAPDESEREHGNGTLGRDCRLALGEGLWLMYATLASDDERLRERAVQIVYATDPDRARLAIVLDDLMANDPAAGVRDAAVEFHGYMPGVVFDT
jgi:hypothetical protein